MLKFLKIRNGYTNIAVKMQRKLAQNTMMLLIKIKTSKGREKTLKNQLWVSFLPFTKLYSRGCLYMYYNIGAGPGMIMVCDDKLKSGFLHNNLLCELLGQASSYR